MQRNKTYHTIPNMKTIISTYTTHNYMLGQPSDETSGIAKQEISALEDFYNTRHNTQLKYTLQFNLSYAGTGKNDFNWYNGKDGLSALKNTMDVCSHGKQSHTSVVLEQLGLVSDSNLRVEAFTLPAPMLLAFVYRSTTKFVNGGDDAEGCQPVCHFIATTNSIA